ncbi:MULTISPECIES: CNP1-like family protein [unclassified Neisseria]|uniref:CNP1-like family protein n=1 Tax=unclassified Neisseria TaxID=2623750 RepID=UPI002665139D|nr:MULTISPECIES: CNP1-like family protein [unclassified Neisseria]MDO1508885.1 CNP1-like family protein [Neisseria sp. MVDL19-042950]MDO1515144.1 CNP1-like family protein [Neisseria sp. MVDL18-041461]MDO1562504.1 CNP1-like family protein [Neisseria sp. MVDL20-010259]
MRRFLLLVPVLAAAHAFAAPHHDKDTLTNSRYQESTAEKAAREFKEADVALPAFPDTRNGGWFDIYVNNTYTKKPKILLDSIALAPDGTVRYVLNIQSKQGYDNLSSEGIFCAGTSFSLKESQRSSFKVFGYGDTVNKRWITPRNGEWKPIGAILNTADPVRGVLYRAFCEDGKPENEQALRERVIRRAGSRSLSAGNPYK